MSVEIDDQGTVTSGGRPVDYATAYGWAVDSPETITDLVHDTKAFVTVIAAAEHAGPEEQAAAVRKAFAAGVPRAPGASWAAAAAQETAPQETVPSEPAASDPDAGSPEPATSDTAPQEPAADAAAPQEPAAGRRG
ncbi:hypothetical protein [Kocuria sp. SM24M-10]|uniref:hypothetical protein n=1 Tax=Kocuria sp. SM24M-10 TaxID=1660349 RepID=UPI000649FBCB|nr:hypothetical protein [Kocuria sp. SM24M-10]KLU09418.1 hypothetical protein ABL57_12360 [Kocuria sp. SM24M-10]